MRVVSGTHEACEFNGKHINEACSESEGFIVWQLSQLRFYKNTTQNVPLGGDSNNHHGSTYGKVKSVIYIAHLKVIGAD